MVYLAYIQKSPTDTLPIHRLHHEVQPLQLGHSIPEQDIKKNNTKNQTVFAEAKMSLSVLCFENQREFINERVNTL